jgi:hypothetical protein
MAIELKPQNQAKQPWPPPNSSPYKVQDNEDWASVATKFKMTVRDLIIFNFGTERPGEINWYLHHYVGCPQTQDKRNRVFCSSANPGYIYYPTIRMPPETITGLPAWRINLDEARSAYNYTKSKLTIGALNKWSDIVDSLGLSVLCVWATQSVDFPVPRSPVPTWLRKAAATAEAAGCGNCGTNAAVAFMWLYDNGIFPIDYMSGFEFERKTGVDHAFVVIGREDASDQRDPKTWGDSAVVCDPWDDKYFRAAEFRDKMYKGKLMKPVSWVRALSATDVRCAFRGCDQWVRESGVKPPGP